MGVVFGVSTRRLNLDDPLGVLAFGWRGVEAWRKARGTDWIDERRRAWEDAKAKQPESVDPPAEAAPLAPVPTSGATSAESDAPVIIVSGLPRSGTSMLMQMLEAGGVAPFTDQNREADASNPRGYYEHDAVKALAKDATWIPEAAGHALKVVAPLVPHLPVGPRYVVLLLDRSLDEILASQAAMLDRSGHAATDAERLRPTFLRYLHDAREWILRTPEAESVPVRHADLIANPEETAQRLADDLARLGVIVDAAAMGAVVDPALYRQRA